MAAKMDQISSKSRSTESKPLVVGSNSSGNSYNFFSNLLEIDEKMKILLDQILENLALYVLWVRLDSVVFRKYYSSLVKKVEANNYAIKENMQALKRYNKFCEVSY